MKYYVSMGTREMEVELGPHGTTVDGVPVSADLMEMDGTDVYSLLLGKESYRILATRMDADDWSLHLAGRHLVAQVVDERTKAIREMAGMDDGPKGPKALRAPMPGMVVKVETEVGAEVQAGQGLVIVEAMKMENELKAEGAGKVSRLHIQAGETVEKDQILVEFEVPAPLPQKGSEE